MRKLVMGLVAAVSLTGLWGCSFAPEYKRPMMELPSDWKTDATHSEQLDVQWWRRFNDPELNALITEALEHNKDIAVSVAQVDFARAQLGIARANQMPLLSGSAQATPTWVNGNRVTQGTLPYQAGFGASWEIDLWGKLRNAKDASLYQLMSTESSMQGLRLSIAAQTANGYFLLRSLELQLSIAQRTLTSREDAYTIYNARFEQGLINELDLVRAKTEVETAKTSLYNTRVSRDAAESALIALAGRSPREIMTGSIRRGASLEVIPNPPVIPAGVPSDLLTRRPDIQQAEWLMQAANANIGVAKAAWFPSISLTAMLGVMSPELHNLFSNPQDTWNYGATGSVPLLDFGRIQSNVAAVEAKQREAMAVYEKTVQGAFRDMRDALSRQQESTNIVDSLERTVKDLRLAVDLAKTRYDNGYSSYLEVLDAERSLFDSELSLASARSNRLTSIVNVCLALGGGWKE